MPFDADRKVHLQAFAGEIAKIVIMEEMQSGLPKAKFKRLHKDTCGVARMEYDNYDDVRLACERKLMEWERLGIIPPWQSPRNNDWLFAR